VARLLVHEERPVACIKAFIKTLAEEGDGNTEITGTMALLGGLLTLTR